MKASKKFLFAGCGAVAFMATLFPPNHSAGQASGDEAAMSQIISEIVAQQTQLAENQKAIEARLATIEENMRIARIYVSRGGGARK